MRVPRRAIAALAAAGGYAVLYGLGLVSGSTSAERRCVLPGDELIDGPTLVTNHAATLPAPPEHVWQWMTQVGWLDLAYRAIIVPADHIMATGMLDGLTRRLKNPDGPQGT